MKILCTIAVTVTMIASGQPAIAKANRPEFPLVFTPQQAIDSASTTLDSSMFSSPVAIILKDGRNLQDPAEIGQRTDDDDRVYKLRATTEILAFVDEAIRHGGRSWGLPIADSGDHLLAGSLLQFTLQERNQAVGAVYNANVTLFFVLRDDDGAELWSGTATGDATRYGRKFSAANSNEVLSDAVLESWAAILSDPGLHQAWRGERRATVEELQGPRDAAAPAKEVVSPAELLTQLKAMMEKNVSMEIIAAAICRLPLSRPMTADDMLYWRQASMPPQVIETARRCPVQDGGQVPVP